MHVEDGSSSEAALNKPPHTVSNATAADDERVCGLANVYNAYLSYK
jgi:hypothetical protein